MKKSATQIGGGKPGSENSNWKGGAMLKAGYRLVMCPDHPLANKGGYVREHILVVEHAMGKRLRRGAVVHHVNGIKNDNRPGNLVVCHDDAYHNLLHTRTRALRDCGNADARRCCYCKTYGTVSNGIVVRDDRGAEHVECGKVAARGRWARAKAQKTPSAPPKE